MVERLRRKTRSQEAEMGEKLGRDFLPGHTTVNLLLLTTYTPRTKSATVLP